MKCMYTLKMVRFQFIRKKQDGLKLLLMTVHHLQYTDIVIYCILLVLAVQ